MILVTLGTQDKSFVRLLEAIEKEINNGNIKDKVIVQAGYTKFESKNMVIYDLIPYEKFDKLVKECDLLITHGGVASILNGITVRMYDIHGIDDLVPLVNGDGDVDIFFGAGGNFDDKFGTDKVTIAPTSGYSIGEETKRYNAIFDQNNATAKLIYDFMNTEDGIKLWDMNTLYEGKTEEPSEPNVSADNVAEVNLNVLDTKVENKKYHL